MTVFWDKEKIRQAISVLVISGKVFEVRIIRKRPKQVLSGYFKDAKILLKELERIELNNSNVYVTLNAVKDECHSAEQHDKFLPGAIATSDRDIDYYSWLFIDLDPKRKSGISATNEERKAAFTLATKIYNYLRAHNFSEPVKAVSGNGSHLLYKIALANNAENKELLQNCLNALDAMFSNDAVEVDTSTATPSHTVKLYGTLAQKGANTPDRPHRMSQIVYVPDNVETNDRAKLEWLANQLPQSEETPVSRAYTHLKGQFDIEAWMREHGLAYTTKTFRDGIKYVLDTCPFNSCHKAPDSSIFKYSNGKIGFKCFHNSCQDRTWKDVRLLYEPDAYTKAERTDWQIETGWNRHINADRELPKLDINRPATGEPIFLTANDIVNSKEPDTEYISTGIPGIDTTMKGLAKGTVSVLSGLRASAKSTFLSQLILEMIDKNQTVVCYSGELSAKNFMKWMMLQAAGKRHVQQSIRYRNFYVVDSEETEKKIAAWMQNRFYLFNNSYGNKFSALAKMLKEQAEKVKADCIILDNLMAVNLDYRTFDKYEAQTAFVWELKNIAKQTNAVILFVAHPRKTAGFLRLSDISGSANIGNIVDSAFIIHRNNEDFSKATAEYFGKKKSHYIPENCSNILEICKDRENGTQDFFIPLWYEPETKRLRSDTERSKHYGWETMFNRQTPLLPEQDSFQRGSGLNEKAQQSNDLPYKESVAKI